MSLEKRFEELPDELKDKARACTSSDELVALAKDNAIDLTDEELEAIAGGGWGCPDYTYDCPDNYS